MSNKMQLVKDNTQNKNKKDKLPDPDEIKFYPVLEQSRELQLYELIMTKHPPSWSEFFMSVEKEVKHACTMIERSSNLTGKALFPFTYLTLSAFWLTPLFMLKSVIIGQDPYPGLTKEGMPKAQGLCFSSKQNYEMPASLKYIYKELERTVEGWEDPGHPDLSKWGKQGVLLINSALTVEAGNAGSHVGFWKPFTNKLMEYINEKCKNVVFLLWGKKAQSVASGIYTSKHLKLEAYHSPMSLNSGYSFGGCDHFNKANIYLVENGIEPIDWRLK